MFSIYPTPDQSEMSVCFHSANWATQHTLLTQYNDSNYCNINEKVNIDMAFHLLET